MKSIRFILLALICTLLLVACERPAPAGEVPVPAENNSTEIIPRTDESYPAPETNVTPTESTESPDATSPETTTETTTDTQPAAEGETTEPETTETETTTDEPTAEAPPLEDGVYVVRAGDTLGQIAFIYNITVEDLMAANNLTNPDVLDVGQQLVIPDAGFAETADSTPSDETTTEQPSDETPGTEQIHIVQPGDNLYRIGLNYGFTIDELAEYNNLTDVNNLEVGQEIRIPPSN
ncbi:MAG: LysM peptidoglycan-binding domain-containing protein [Ardenticatenaceae bacterium]|nr:LysM peptidoglycan-binding domain-containing protein [Ardenticatenaceae bacterium]